MQVNQLVSHYIPRDWDLWGPLVLCLTLGILLSINVRLHKATHTLADDHILSGPTCSVARSIYQCSRNHWSRVLDRDCASQG